MDRITQTDAEESSKMSLAPNFEETRNEFLERKSFLDVERHKLKLEERMERIAKLSTPLECRETGQQEPLL
jgi:hypothetical protein